MRRQPNPPKNKGRQRHWSYWTSSDGSESVEAEMEALAKVGPSQRKGVAKLVTKMENFQTGVSGFKDVKALRDGVYELRVKVKTDYYRLLFSYKADDEILALLAVYKDQDKLPPQIIDRAVLRSANWP